MDPTKFIMLTAQLMRQQLEDDTQLDKETVVKMPDKFKIGSSWKVFSEAVETYISQLLGTGRDPLSGVIKKYVIANADALYETEQDQMIAIAPLSGASYQQDHTRVYGIIKQLVKGSRIET
jgi:alcohol dehydrogenase class IV